MEAVKFTLNEMCEKDSIRLATSRPFLIYHPRAKREGNFERRRARAAKPTGQGKLLEGTFRESRIRLESNLIEPVVASLTSTTIIIWAFH